MSCFSAPRRWCGGSCPTHASWSSATVRGGPSWSRWPANCRWARRSSSSARGSDVPELLALLDVLVLTSHMEANPVSILEAMAAEKPVISTQVGSVSETVLDGTTGYLVAPGGAEELAARMVELLRDPQRAAVMGRAGREHVVAHWSIEGTVAGYQNLLEDIYAAKSARRVTVPGDCPDFRGEARENGTVPFGG